MTLSNLTAYTNILEGSAATPGLFDVRFSQADANIRAVDATISQVSSQITVVVNSAISSISTAFYGSNNSVLVDPSWYGFSASATSIVNRNALLSAIAALPLRGGEIKLPPGKFQTSYVSWSRHTVTLTGSGIDQTELQYTSCYAGTNDGAGSAVMIGDQSATTLTRAVIIRDLHFRDLSTSTWTGTPGHLPAAIDTFNNLDILIERCKFTDIKGNSAINVLGAATNNTTPLGTDCIIQDCVFEGTSAGSYIEGDALNAQHFNRLIIRRNRHLGGCLRHAFEFGTANNYLEIADNYIDMNNQGKACVASFTIMQRGFFHDNQFLNWSAVDNAIEVNPDLPTLPCVNLDITDNYFFTPFSGLGAIATSDGTLAYHRYERNTFDCLTPISLGKIPAGRFVINNNHSKWTGNGNIFITVSGNPAFANTSDVLEVAYNTLQGRTDLQVIDYANWSNAKDARLKIHDNVLQNPYTNAADGLTSLFTALAANLANLASCSTVTSVCTGVIPLDRIESIESTNPLPSGVLVRMWSDTTDVLSGSYFNFSGATLNSATKLHVYGRVRRL